ncbi:diacylglycerol/lipid kinase family protein [Oleiharenicola lentus]|uniref:diacylglycerol/lipid kinase family protein n=1 Tax=Oleiharenicola lentus TaxID=2508720 RepID=UPI003F665342
MPVTSSPLKVRFIFNPHSGSNRRNPYLRDRAVAFIAEHQLDGEVVATERPRHATELARAAIADGCTHVVAIGGDGTMNEVACALIGTQAIFGLIPCGSGNGLGRHLGIQKPNRHAFDTLLNGRALAIDSGMVNSDPFFCAAGIGFEALIAGQFSLMTSRGFQGYIRASAKAWRSYQPETYTIRHADGVAKVTAFTLAIANSAQYGNNAYIAPGASVSDGLLDVTAVPPVGLLSAPPLLWHLFRGSLGRVKSVLRLRGKTFMIEREKPGWVHTDGEPRAETQRLEISIKPQSLRMMVPQNAAPSHTPPN